MGPLELIPHPPATSSQFWRIRNAVPVVPSGGCSRATEVGAPEAGSTDRALGPQQAAYTQPFPTAWRDRPLLMGSTNTTVHNEQNSDIG